MPDIRTLEQVQQESIHIVGVTSGTVHPSKVEVATIEFPYERYTGSYEVTPAAQSQTISTKDKLMTDNIVINPIPSNYGLIEWNGSTLTVS
jgi:hypothetical protein